STPPKPFTCRSTNPGTATPRPEPGKPTPVTTPSSISTSPGTSRPPLSEASTPRRIAAVYERPPRWSIPVFGNRGQIGLCGGDLVYTIAAMAEIRLDHVTKQFGAVTAVDDVSLDVGDGEFLVLVGPSGCGKSTLLRMIAGLEDVSGGEISIGDRD